MDWMTGSDDNKSAGGDDEVTIVQPTNVLAAKVRKVSGSLDDLLNNSERMLASMKDDFDIVMENLIAELSTTYTQRWLPEAGRSQGIVALAHAARGIKAKAGSFGFGLLSNIADLFSEYLDDTPVAEQKSAAVLSYVDSMQVVWRQKISGDGGAIGQQIIADLKKLNVKATGGA